MISIDMSFYAGGLFQACRVKGHAMAGPKGSDIVCAAVSILCNSAYKALSQRKDEPLEGITVKAGAPQGGDFSLDCSLDPDAGEPDVDYLTGVANVLMEGFQSLAYNYPESVKLNIQYEEE